MMKNNFDNHKFSQPPVHSPVKNEGIIYHLLGYPYPLKRKVWFTPQIPPGGFRYLYSMYVNKESYDPEAPFTHTLANNYDQDKRTTDDSVKTEEIDFSRLSKIKPDIHELNGDEHLPDNQGTQSTTFDLPGKSTKRKKFPLLENKENLLDNKKSLGKNNNRDNHVIHDNKDTEDVNNNMINDDTKPLHTSGKQTQSLRGNSEDDILPKESNLTKKKAFSQGSILPKGSTLSQGSTLPKGSEKNTGSKDKKNITRDQEVVMSDSDLSQSPADTIMVNKSGETQKKMNRILTTDNQVNLVYQHKAVKKDFPLIKNKGLSPYNMYYKGRSSEDRNKDKAHTQQKELSHTDDFHNKNDSSQKSRVIIKKVFTQKQGIHAYWARRYQGRFFLHPIR